MSFVRAHADAIALAALMLAIFVLRFVHLSEYAFHEDELLSITAMKSIVETGLPLQENGQLYWRSLLGHYLMALPLLLADVSLHSARLVPVLFSVLLLPVVFGMGRSVEGRWAGWVAVLFLAFSDFENRHASFARFYTPFAFFFVSAVYLAGAHAIERRRHAGRWLLAATLAAILTHRLALQLVPIFGLALLVGRRLDLLRSGRHLASGVPVAVALYLTHVYRPADAFGVGVGIELVRGAMTDKAFFFEQFRRFAPLATTLGILGVAPLVLPRRDAVQRRLWVFYAGSFLGSMIGLSLVSPGMMVRYMVHLFPLGVLLAAASLVWWSKQAVQFARERSAPERSWRTGLVAAGIAAALVHALTLENGSVSQALGRHFKPLDQKPAHDVLARYLRHDDVVISMAPSLTRLYLDRPADFLLREKRNREAGGFVPFSPEEKQDRLVPVIDRPELLEELVTHSQQRVWLYANYKILSTTSPRTQDLIYSYFTPVFGHDRPSGSVLFVAEPNARASTR